MAMTRHNTFGILKNATRMGSAGLALMMMLAASANAGDLVRFSIAEQDIGTALKAYADQAKVSIMFSPTEVTGQRVHGLSGNYEPDEALRLLLKGTGFIFERTSGNMLSVKKPALSGPRSSEQSSSYYSASPTQTSLNQTKVLPAAITTNAATGAASDDQVDGIEEVVVTARKREERLQNVPISITAFSGKGLALRSFTDLSQIADATPNMQFTVGSSAAGNGNEANVFIRGIGQRDGQITSDAGVGIYVDGVYLARAQGGVLDLLDIERIEVLRGPQGTLFGKNTIGGAINIITSLPGEEFGGKMQATMGRFHRVDIDGIVNFPLVENRLFAKLAFASRDRDGYIKRVLTGERDSNQNRQTVRGALRWLASENIEAVFRADYTRQRERGIGYTPLSIPGSFLTALWNIATGDTFDSRWVPDDPYKTFATGQSINNSDTWGMSLTLDWDLEWGRVRSITAYRNISFKYVSDADGSPVPLSDNDPSLVNGDQFSQEIQLSGLSFGNRLTWLAGLYYFTETPVQADANRIARGLFEALEAAPGLLLGPFGGAGNPANAWLDIMADTVTRESNDTYSAFFQGTFSVTQKLSLTAGARYNYEKKNYSFTQVYPRTGETVLDLTRQNSWSSFTPRFEIGYQVTPDHLLYATVSRGFKMGGFNPNPSSASAAEPYDEEFVWSYEAGFKTQWFRDRLRLNGSLFLNDYSNIQLLTTRLDPAIGMLVLVKNGGNARIKGFELELTARPTTGLDFSASVGYLNAKYTKLREGTFITKDMDLPQAPKWTVNLSGQYAAPLANAGTLTMRVDYQYVDDFISDPENNPITRQKGFSTVNARLSYSPPSGNWQASLFGTNLTNVAALSNAFFSRGGGEGIGIFRAPREWGASLEFQF
jgi:iron complex outermembrane receptor protein